MWAGFSDQSCRETQSMRSEGLGFFFHDFLKPEAFAEIIKEALLRCLLGWSSSLLPGLHLVFDVTSGWLVWTTKTCVVQTGSCRNQLLRGYFFSCQNSSGLLYDIIWTRDWMALLFSSVCMRATEASVTRETFTPSSLPSHVQCVKCARSLRRHVGCYPKDKSIYVLESNLVKPNSLCNMHTIQKKKKQSINIHFDEIIIISFFGVGCNNIHTKEAIPNLCTVEF